jgi:uncharacterized protein (DUF433 family)
MESSRQLIRWLAGHDGGHSTPVLVRDYQPVAGRHELSFWDLMEVRFIDHFRKQNVPLQTLRRFAEKMRADSKRPHPLALSKVKFLTDRKKVFAQIVEEDDDRKTIDVLGDQYEMYEMIEDVLAKSLSFDVETHLATQWRPLAGDCPNVVIDPRFAYGHPVISNRQIPTAALFRAWKAEHGDLTKVAEWFGLQRDEVIEAVHFEIRLAG